MNQPPSQPGELLGAMDSLADPARLRLLRLLERQELGVVELCDVLQMPQSTVSRHLRILADQGWIAARRQGTNNLYRMLPGELSPLGRRLWHLAREQTESWPAPAQDEVRLQRLLRERGSQSEAFFAGAAGEWDQLRTELYGRAFQTAAVQALIPSDWLVADLGCGTASLTAELAPFVAGVIGVDQSQAMLKAARKRTAGLANVELRRGELDAIPIEAGICDAALLVLVLTYVADVARVLAETRRILRPGGRVVVVDLLCHDREDFRRQMGQQRAGFESPAIVDLLRQAGFAKASARPLPAEAECRGPALFLATGVTPP